MMIIGFKSFFKGGSNIGSNKRFRYEVFDQIAETFITELTDQCN